MSGRGCGKVQDSLSLATKIDNGEMIGLMDVSCPICLSILLEPVEMPCKHTVCSPCFQDILTHANTSCPICRTRLSTWCRKATKQKKLVSEKLWSYIKDNFGDEVMKRQSGVDIDVDEVFPCIPNHIFAQQGEIKSEFDAHLRRAEEERLQATREEEERSSEYIRSLQEQESAVVSQHRQDEELARLIHNTPSPGKENRRKLFRKKTGPLDMYFASPKSSQVPPKSSQVSPKSSQVSPKSSQGTVNSSGLETVGSQQTEAQPSSSKQPRMRSPTTGATATARIGRVKALFSSNNITGFRMLNGMNTRCETVTSDVSSVASCSSSRFDYRNLPDPSDAERPDLERLPAVCNTSEDPSVLHNNLEDLPLPLIHREAATADGREGCLLEERQKEHLEPTGFDTLAGSQSLLASPSTCDIEENRVEQNLTELNNLAELSASSSSEPSLPVTDDMGNKAFLEEQRRIVEQIEQERRDREVALKIQSEIDILDRTVDRRKGSMDAYSLRGTPLSSKKGGKRSRHASKEGRQMSIQESFKKSKLSSSGSQ